MKSKIRRILLAVRDPSRPPRAALRKVAGLARATHAAVELFHALSEPGDPASPAGAAALKAARRRLERMARTPLLEDCRPSAHVEWDYPPHEAIVRRALRIGADLVIATAQPSGFGKRLWLRNTDWELIRHCPCQLLIVKSARAYRKPRILVAVDPMHAHAKPTALDQRLLASAKALASTLSGSVHIFHAYMPLVASVQGPMGEPLVWESPEVEEVHSAQIAREFARVAAQGGIVPRNRHLMMGDVPTLLEGTVRKLHAGLAVMGAVSRSRLRRLVVGSTAERVLDQLTCDVLIVKPRGFATSVPKRMSAVPARR